MGQKWGHDYFTAKPHPQAQRSKGLGTCLRSGLGGVARGVRPAGINGDRDHGTGHLGQPQRHCDCRDRGGNAVVPGEQRTGGHHSTGRGSAVHGSLSGGIAG